MLGKCYWLGNTHCIMGEKSTKFSKWFIPEAIEYKMDTCCENVYEYLALVMFLF